MAGSYASFFVLYNCTNRTIYPRSLFLLLPFIKDKKTLLQVFGSKIIGYYLILIWEVK
jgi:hypothetical protein